MFLSTNSDKVIIGYDLANTYSQISYCYIKGKSEVETFSSVAGEENYDIPTVLCKRIGVNQWYAGNEALRICEEEPDQVIPVDNLVELALDGEELQIDGEMYEPEKLLALFVKKSLGLMSGIAPLEKVEAIMFTCDVLTKRMVELLDIIAAGLALKNTKVFYQNYTESFYSYMIYQPKELWTFRSLLFDYRTEKLKYMCMECNKKTTPIVVYIDRETLDFDGTDEQMYDISNVLLGGDRVSSVYLIGERFASGWMKKSLKALCAGRRVFQGNNLYSKGACFCLMERLQGSVVGGEYVFLGNDKLKANVGMRVIKRGEPAYYALLDAGNNWYELQYSCELYLRDEEELEFEVSPLIGKDVKVMKVSLEGLELKPGECTRIRMDLHLIQENIMCVRVQDLGFGEFRAPVDNIWEEQLELY